MLYYNFCLQFRLFIQTPPAEEETQGEGEGGEDPATTPTTTDNTVTDGDGATPPIEEPQLSGNFHLTLQKTCSIIRLLE